MRVLVACEESQAVCKAFRALGHEAYSCDIEPCSGGASRMAHPSGCVGTAQNEMGLDYCPPAVYLHDKRRSRPNESKRQNRAGAV